MKDIRRKLFFEILGKNCIYLFLKYYFVLLKFFENYVVEKGRAGYDNSNNKDTYC
jgi:hypothetical protein